MENRNMRPLTDPGEIAYTFDAMRDLANVRNGIKPLVIVSAGKCTMAYELASDIVDDDDALESRFACLACEDGELHEMIFICQAGAPYAGEAIELIFDAVNQAVITRNQLQLRLGLLLGHSAAECLAFSRSWIGLTCPCDCCGGEPQKLLTHQARDDAHKARSMEFCAQY